MKAVPFGREQRDGRRSVATVKLAILRGFLRFQSYVTDAAD
jgi:hypothetical protein